MGIDYFYKDLSKPIFEQSSSYFRVVIKRPDVELLNEQEDKSAEKWSEKWSEISEKQKEIIEILLKDPRISRQELSLKLKINRSAVQKHIEKLKKKGILERVGPDKGGYWKINK